MSFHFSLFFQNDSRITKVSHGCREITYETRPVSIITKYKEVERQLQIEDKEQGLLLMFNTYF